MRDGLTAPAAGGDAATRGRKVPLPTIPLAAWQRLGDLLVQRRIQLNPRYRDRRRLASANGLSWRLLYDVERAKRTNFTTETLLAFEAAYRWAPGSVASVLAGGDPVPLPPQREDPPGPWPLSLAELAAIAEED